MHRACIKAVAMSMQLLVAMTVFGQAVPAVNPVPLVETKKPNIVLIMADDLGFGEVGYYGQKLIKTPRIDELASQGMAFTQFYAGATVCAPSRCTLMTGRHNGHATVRGNAGAEDSIRQSLTAEDYTLAEMLKERGYDTACIGKWGLGELGEPGHPMDQGFDHFFGYLSQVHAHNYFPGFLYRDKDPVTLRNEVVLANPTRGDVGGGYATTKLDYSPDLMMDRAIEFVTRPRSAPFFLYLALTLPHGNNEANRMLKNGAEVPDWSEYEENDWTLNTKQHAAMVSRLDTCVGRVVDHLRRLGIEDETLVVFTSDNGPHNESSHQLELFQPAGELRGQKRALYEGGVRVPTICSWPGMIPAGAVSDHVGYSGDFFQTFAELSGELCDPNKGPIDSISITPTLFSGTNFDEGTQKQHEYIYFEFYEQGSRQSVRFGNWKAIREPMLTGKIQLYNLAEDIAEQVNLADVNPEVVERAKKYMDEAHVPNERWTVPVLKAK